MKSAAKPLINKSPHRAITQRKNTPGSETLRMRRLQEEHREQGIVRGRVAAAAKRCECSGKNCAGLFSTLLHTTFWRQQDIR
ncbi:hypothetical protein JTE90_027823 [Oedothorax gibbosus]|uniref:Uncharacterized protein n=1 Tax=Oedothorax gibbosus TaxID=931172 RepID=A0AAV6U5L5_9ARAC|nr:hypothetical protein JTE90_027823 [Oedothorax gibbosus]